MIALLAVLVVTLQQAPAAGQGPTVGDTIAVVASFRLPASVPVRPPAWSPPPPFELLSGPALVRHGDTIEVRLAVRGWEPGTYVLEVPGPLFDRRGTLDSLAPVRVPLAIRSVLPPGKPDSAIPPQPQAGVLSQTERSLVPVAVAVGSALLVLLPFGLWWFRWPRRSRKVPQPLVVVPAIPLDRWLASGEDRVAVSIVAVALRDAVAAAGPVDPALAGQVADALGRLDRARFEDVVPPDAAALVEEGRRLTALLAALPPAGVASS